MIKQLRGKKHTGNTMVSVDRHTDITTTSRKRGYREKHERKPAREKELSMAKGETDEKDISNKRKGREANTSFRTAYAPSWHCPDIPTALPKLPHTPFFLFTDHKSSCTGKEKALTTGALL